MLSHGISAFTHDDSEGAVRSEAGSLFETPACCSEVNWSTSPARPKPGQTLGSEAPSGWDLGPKSARNYSKRGQDVGRNHNGPDLIPEEMQVRPVICGAPGGI